MSATSFSAATPERLGAWRTGLKAAALFGHFLAGLGVLLLLPVAGGRAGRLAAWWYRRFLRLLGVRVHVRGRPPAEGALGVANHVSWLDIIVLGSLVDAAFVSKTEVGNWPLVGRFARHTGTVFLPRGAYRTGEAAERLRAAMAEGRCVILFPEATTNADLAPAHFHARLFGAAVDGGYPAQPIAVHYLPPEGGGEGHHPLAPWVDEDLVPHFLGIFRMPRLDVRVTFCEPVPSAGRDRRWLAEDSRQAIVGALRDECAVRATPAA